MNYSTCTCTEQTKVRPAFGRAWSFKNECTPKMFRRGPPRGLKDSSQLPLYNIEANTDISASDRSVVN